ncbi:LytTR family DNA-binding domain-containing protein [Chitinophaga sp. CF418]|uniref:LytR/AlgR family response regulator transcription factor n=1 Tax=Chitinophaga sp. CF418 TaxID=1855287 RepID=UPI00091D5E3F|nr:LytTR family DNA-binding domain-containing protein [Chitinophaga sp. CF418]SHN28286.1 LytTr DNA-binding domain-containing protein [Chitinophaga sp. CF418]
MKDRILITCDADNHEVILTRNILYISVKLNYCTIKLSDNRKILLRQSLKQVEEQLPEDMFCRVHRSYIISLEHVEKVCVDLIVMGNVEVPFGENYKKDFFRRFRTLQACDDDTDSNSSWD